MQRLSELWSDLTLTLSNRADFDVGHIFYTSNDYISLPEIVRLRNSQSAEYKSEQIANILVAESNFLSAIHGIEGDIIFCDIDKALLNFLKWQVDFFLRNADLPVAQAKKLFLKACKEQYDSENISTFVTCSFSTLGSLHFLDNENNFKRAMQALKTKRFAFLNISLFIEDEQELLCNALRCNNLKIRLVNLTNLPDYDYENKLYKLLENLPWTQELTPIIVWNIHDRGPFSRSPATNHKNKDLNTHYLFTAHSFQEYKKAFEEEIPSMLGKVDRLFTGESKDSPDRFNKFQQSIRQTYLKSFTTASLKAIDHCEYKSLALYPRPDHKQCYSDYEAEFKEFDVSAKENNHLQSAQLYFRLKQRLRTAFDLPPKAKTEESADQKKGIVVANETIKKLKLLDTGNGDVNYNLFVKQILDILSFIDIFQIKDKIFEDLREKVNQIFTDHINNIFQASKYNIHTRKPGKPAYWEPILNTAFFLESLKLLNANSIQTIKLCIHEQRATWFNKNKFRDTGVNCYSLSVHNLSAAVRLFLKSAKLTQVSHEEQIKTIKHAFQHLELCYAFDATRSVQQISHLLNDLSLFKLLLKSFGTEDQVAPAEEYSQFKYFVKLIQLSLPTKAFNDEQQTIIDAALRHKFKKINYYSLFDGFDMAEARVTVPKKHP